MIWLILWVVYGFLAAANPIKNARGELENNKGLTQKDYLVTKLPGLTENIPSAEIPLMFAGQLPLYEENNTHYFFWKFVDRQKEPRAENKTIFWLNGGPGCLSMDGALMEAGPFRINERKQVSGNPGSWHRKGDIVFVDQPAGTGFSYSNEFDSELAEVAWHFLTFLDRFFALFPEDANNEILLAGESYAGQYIPYIAREILERNARNDAQTNLTDLKYNLKGLLIGNGYISPNEQGLSFIPFAVQNGLISTDHLHWKNLLEAHQGCQKAVDETAKEGSDASAFAIVGTECDRVLTLLLQYTLDRLAPLDKQCFNMYDYTLKDSYPSCGMNWPPDLANVSPFLTKEAVMADLNLVLHKHWLECSGPVGSHLRAKKSEPSIKLFPDLLDKVQIVLFHGDRDIICNYIGAELMIKKLEWGGKRGFSEDIVKYEWRHNGSVEGYLMSERNLTFINVYNASHMVPFDKPEVSRALVDLLYKDYDVEPEQDGNPHVLTYPVGHKKASQSELEGADASDKAHEVNAEPLVNLTEGSSQDKGQDEPQTSRIVRVIQFTVIVVLIWGVCALYSTYKSKPTSIIKTKPTGRKKNVSWADELESAVGVLKEPASTKSPSLITKAFSKLKKPDTQGDYQRVDHEEIELREGVAEGDDFIIGSDDEAEEMVNSEMATQDMADDLREGSK